MLFQHTAARRRLDWALFLNALGLLVSTHSRPKAAGLRHSTTSLRWCGFNTQPPEGGWSRPAPLMPLTFGFQHTAARRRLEIFRKVLLQFGEFQHTAARRRLGIAVAALILFYRFQHTAARRRLANQMPFYLRLDGFNTQPPEGGWSLSQKPCSIRFRSPDFARLPRKARMRV